MDISKTLARAMVLALSMTGQCGVASAADVSMVAPLIPPHFDETGAGRIGDVIRAVMGRCDHFVRFTIVPFGRHWKDYDDDEGYDALATAEADQTFRGHTTKPFIHLQDGATVLAKSRFADVVRVDELAGARVVAFPNAARILDIEATVPAFASFRQRGNRFDQVRPLLAERADVVLADGLITAYYIHLLAERKSKGKEPDIDPGLPVIFRRIFEPGPQRLYFRDPALARDFDRCHAALAAEGAIDDLTRPYVERFGAVLGDQYPSQ